MSLLLFSLFVTLIPATSAGILDKFGQAYACYSNVEIGYDEKAAKDPLLPLDRTKTIPLTIKYSITGYYAKEIASLFKDTPIYLNLYVEENPDWCIATILPFFTSVYARGSSFNASLSIEINENSYAFSEGKIKIKVVVVKAGSIEGGNFYQDIPFLPGYLPVLGTKLTSTSDLISPMETANFNIEIENLGNAKTEVACRVIESPKGWIATIDPTIIIESGTASDNPKKNIQLVVKPPYNFGYHNDKGIIKVSVTPSFFGNSSLSGHEYILSFIVQSRGFSTPGFEVVSVLLAIIAIILVIKKRQKTIRSNNINDKKGGDHR